MHAFVNAFLERQAVFLQPRHPRQVARRPAGWEVLNRALLVGQEQQHVHARDLPGRRGAARFRAGRGRSRGGGASAEQDAGGGDSGRLQQVAAGDAVPVVLAVARRDAVLRCGAIARWVAVQRGDAIPRILAALS